MYLYNLYSYIIFSSCHKNFCTLEAQKYLAFQIQDLRFHVWKFTVYPPRFQIPLLLSNSGLKDTKEKCLKIGI